MYYLRTFVAFVALAGPLTCLADAGIYSFVDGNAEIYLSNVPDDDRYQVLIAPPAPQRGTAKGAPTAADNTQRYGPLIEQVADQTGIDAALLHAVISVESGYNPNARSKKGAGGLMQLMPATAKRYGVADVFDPAENIRGGAQYLADLLKEFENNIRLALAAYNAGAGAVQKYDMHVPPYPETASYVPKVVRLYRKYRLSM